MSCYVNKMDGIGNTLSPYMQIVFDERIPEYPPLSLPVLPRPAKTLPKGKRSYDQAQKEDPQRRC